MAREKTAEEKIRSFEGKTERGGCNNLRHCTEVTRDQRIAAQAEMNNPAAKRQAITEEIRKARSGR